MTIERRDGLLRSALKDPVGTLRGNRTWSPLSSREQILLEERRKSMFSGSAKVVVLDDCGEHADTIIYAEIEASIAGAYPRRQEFVSAEKVNDPIQPWHGRVRYSTH